MTHARGSSDPSETPLLGRGDEHAATGRQAHALPFWVDRGAGQVGHGVLHPLVPPLVHVRGEGDRDPPRRTTGEVVEPQIGAHLVRDPAVVEARVAHVPAAVPGVLLQIFTVGPHRPDVHRAVAIADEVHASSPPHRRVTLAIVVGRHRHRLVGAVLEAPDLARRSTPVALRHVAVEGGTHEEQRLAAAVVGALAGLGQRDLLVGVLLEVQRYQLQVRLGGVLVRRIDQAAVRMPAGDHRVFPRPGPALGKTAGQGHRVDLHRPLVSRRERQRRSVRRDGRPRLLPGVRRQPSRQAAADRHRPQVAFGGEHDSVAAQRREAVVPQNTLGGGEGGQEQKHGDDSGQQYHSFPHDGEAGQKAIIDSGSNYPPEWPVAMSSNRKVARH